ncbi:MAG TPA: 2Fe-2S iron-sulfur cluster-binding protein [Actinomycetota bacterium]
MTARRLPTGGAWIDRSRPVSFSFDGVPLTGFAGDTVASALLANDVDVVGRSPIEGRPRGVFSAGIEEPNAFVEVSAPWFEPITAATTVDLVDGLVVESRPGVGRLSPEPHGTRPVAHRHRHVEVLVVGAGPAGTAAAIQAAAHAGRVLLVERRQLPGAPELADAGLLEPQIGTTALGLYDDGYVVLHQRGQLETIWHVRAERVILATGAYERPLAFPDNDRPGVMLASAARTYVEAFGVLPGERVVLFTTNHTGYEAASALVAAGAELVAIADTARGGSATDAARAGGTDVRSGWVVAGTSGEERVTAVNLLGPAGEQEVVEADLLLVAGGWDPALQLYRGIGGGLRYDEGIAAFVPDGTGPPWLDVVGAAAGDGLPACTPSWDVPGDDARKYVELQRDQTVADVAKAVARGLRSVEHVKRATYIGTTIDQGRTSGVLTAGITNRLLGWQPDAQGPSNARPPAFPVPFAALAGLDGGPLLDPIRTTPIHPWHVTAGAVFEDVGQWKRPRFYPRSGETMDEAVARECRALRTAAGVLDASTLGKIEVVGPDAGGFLDRMYTNRMSSLPVGTIRYGLMLGLDGMVVDDGVAMRLADDRFLVTTTTGGAAMVLDRFEEWLQTEWPGMRVYCTSVTEQWAVVAVGGPLARDLLAAAGTDLDLTNEAFPFMTLRRGSVAGAPAHVCRVSFTGELSFEVHVPATFGRHVWDAIVAAGTPLGLAPYGTEAMHVLRAEKGFVIVGQDTDGTATPDDLGMGWIVNTGKGDFIGKRSLVRPDTVRPDRKQLVGLLPHEPGLVLPEGTQLVAGTDLAPPVPMLGHVTSSYASAALGRSFALAMVRRGRDLRGSTLVAVVDGRAVPVDVTDPVFVDPEGERRDG